MARILVAPQEFKGSLTAREAAEAIERGILRAAPDAAVDRCPLSDGGPGFVELLSEQLSGRLERARVRDPLGRWRTAQLLVTDDRVVFLEAAQANGLALLREAERDPTNTDSAGVGDLLLAAARYRPRRIVVGVGGSATNDGGAGMARALGARFLDEEGEELPDGVLHLRRLARIEWRRPEAFTAAEVLVATDVDSPLLGPRGATFVFAPQKGARGRSSCRSSRPRCAVTRSCWSGISASEWRTFPVPELAADSLRVSSPSSGPESSAVSTWSPRRSASGGAWRRHRWS